MRHLLGWVWKGIGKEVKGLICQDWSRGMGGQEDNGTMLAMFSASRGRVIAVNEAWGTKDALLGFRGMQEYKRIPIQ